MENSNYPVSSVSKYFEHEPIQWGLRGDSSLWRDMKQKASFLVIPTTKDEFEKLLYNLFRELTGVPAQKGKNIHIKEYETVGLSSGMVCCDFWIEKAFPILIQRYLNNKTE